MKKEHVLEPLDRKEFRRGVKEIFPNVYLTTVSIIQGVALGLLASETFKYIQYGKPGEPWVRFIPYSVMSLLFIIVVAYEYTWFVGFFKWSPRVWDTVIPFVVGFLEIGPIYYLTNPRVWWILTSLLFGSGAVAFGYSLRNSKLYLRADTQVRNRVRDICTWDIFIVLVSVPICLLAGLSYPSGMKVLHWYLHEILSLISLAALVSFLLYKEESFAKGLHEDFNFLR